MMMLAIATLELNAVKNSAIKSTMNRIAGFGRDPRTFKDSAIIEAIPLCLLPSAKAKPPPIKKIRPHGTRCCKNFQLDIDGVVSVGYGPVPVKNLMNPQLAGSTNNKITMRMVGKEFLTFLK